MGSYIYTDCLFVSSFWYWFSSIMLILTVRPRCQLNYELNTEAIFEHIDTPKVCEFKSLILRSSCNI